MEQAEEQAQEIDASKIHYSQFTYSFPPKKIACGIHHSVCISNLSSSSSFVADQSAVVLGWGRNVYNVVGLGEDHRVSLVPAKIDCPDFEKGGGIYEVSCGHSHSLFLRKNRHGPGGEVLGSGLGNRGRQGYPNPHADADDTPEVEDIWFVEGPKAIPISNVPIARIVCGADHSLALDLNGVLWAWGMNADGQCGVGHQRDVLAPEPTVMPKMKGAKVLVAHLAAGSRHSMLVTAKDGSMGSTAGGKVFVWGANSDGRLGLGHDRNEPLPVLVEALLNHKMVLVSAGEAHSAAVDTNGSLYMWGLGSYGRLGLGEVMDVPLARRVPLPDDHRVSQVALGSFHSVVLAGSRTQSVYTWGYGEALGNKVGGGISLSPLVVSLEETKAQVLQIAAGPYHTLVLMEDGELITFGQGASGRLGTGHSKNHKLPVSLGAHGFATKLKHSDGEKAATQKRSLEHPSEKSLKRSAAASSQPGGKQSWEIAKVDCGEMFTCAVTWHGALYTWGSGARGQLGTGSLQDSWVPKVVRMPSGRLVKSMACGREHCIAVTYDGNAYAWGRGDKGQLGVGRNEDTATPKVVEIHNVVSVAAGEDHSGAICRGEDENELWMWGSSELGKLGLGEATSSDSIPVAIRAFAKSTEPYKVPMAVSCGQYHTAVICVRDQDSDEDRISGRVWTFGGGWFGRLGHNDMENQYEPKIISSLITKIRTVHCGAYHTCGLSYEKGIYNDNGELAGDLWVWGRNRCIGEHEHAKVPMKFMQIDGQPKVTCVVTSEMTTMLVTSAGLVYAWGDNRNGQIGLEGGKKESPQPEIIRNLPQPPILMGAGPAHMVVYARNKAMFAWGNQSCGRLGLQEKKMEKVIYKPRLVRAEWGSIEAMSGADDEETAGGDSQKKVTAAALATIGEGRPATEDGSSDVEGSLSEEDEDSGEEDKTKENMLHAITSGQKVQRFSTMQMMLKEEPESNKISSLHKHEKELKKLVESCAHSLAIVTEKERRLSILEDRVQKGIVHLNEILHGPVPKSSEDDRLDQEIKSKLSTYEELFTVLQLQVSYLATLSMTIKDEVSAEVFVNVVCAIFADLQDSRIRNLFILLLHLMTTKELESAKNIDDVFQPSSRVFRLFSFFALHRFHYQVVVHPVMDCHKMDEQGQPVTLMGAVTYKTLEKTQTWALDFNRYLEAPSITAKLKEQASQELRADFQKELDAFVDFFKVDVVAAISRFALPRSFWSFFAFCRESIRECNLVGVEDEAGTEVELKIVEPIFRLFVNGIILPLLRAPKKFGGKEVGLQHCEKNNFDGDVLFNTCTVLDAFQSMTETAAAGNNKESHKRLSKIALRLRPELLRYLLDRTLTADAGAEDPDTMVTVQSFLCHYDRSFRSIYVPPSQLLLFQNLVFFNVNKIRLQSGDRLEEACRKIGRWPEQLVKEATEKAEKNAEVLYRFTLQHRFLFTEGSLTICPASKCTVPLCLSAAAGSDALRRHRDEVNLVQNVDVVRTLKEDNPNKVLEDLFRMLPPLKSSNFVDLKEELEALWTQCAAAQNEALTEKLGEGVQAVSDYIETELSPEEVLDAMASVILSRNRHSRYLHSMSVGLSRLPMEESRHAKEVRSAEQELKAVIEHSKQMLLPERITEVAKLEAAILKGSDLNFLIKKQAARVKTKATKKVTRHNLSDLLSDGKVLECYSELDTVQGKVYLTMWSIDADIIVHVGLLEEGDAMLEFVKQFRIPGDLVKQLPFADREDTTGLPLEGPVIMKWRSLELSKVLKEVPPAD